MTHICVLGNSHVAALKDGWDICEESGTDLSVDFFGCLKDGMASFEMRENGLLGPRDPEAAAFFKDIATTGDFVAADDYDAFVLVGMKFFPNSTIRNYETFATPETNNNETARQIVPEQLLEQALWDDLSQGMMFHVAQVLRSVTDRPIYISWQPFLSEKLYDIAWRGALYEPIIKNGDAGFLKRMMESVDRQLIDKGYIMLHQPVASLTKDIMTAAAWSAGSRQFRRGGGEQHRDADVFHMNGTYGALCWQDWLPKILER